MSKSKVLFLMTGSIACYKACQVISRLTQNNCEVQVVATPAALQFVGNATIEGLTGKSVISDLYAPGSVMDHIHLIRWADLILVAPATANFLNKAAAGIADDLVSTLFLAHDFKKPFLVAPAMNSMMYLHPVTQASLKKLSSMGIELLDTAAGILACGEEGYGRLLEPDQILAAALKSLGTKRSEGTPPKAGKAFKILITAGGTQEPIDSVRKITNTSTGSTGVRLAEGFAELGCDVILLKAESAPQPQAPMKTFQFKHFADLNEHLETQLGIEDFDAVIHLAAVSDYSVASIETEGRAHPPSEVSKLSSSPEEIVVRLKKNFKIVDRLKKYSRHKGIQVVAFKLTSHASAEEKAQAVHKLMTSAQADYVVHNDLTDIDKARNVHSFNLYSRQDASVPCANVDSLLGALSSRILEVRS